jgi:hypothetical protein
MSRRKFLKSSALVFGAPIAAVAGSRLYGVPASVAPRDLPDVSKFTLSLSRAGVPPKLWESLARVGDLWERVLTDEGESASFNSAPAAYMQALGLDSSDKTVVHESVVMLRAMASPEVKDCLRAGDYAGMFSHLSSAGAFEEQSPSALENKIVTALSDNMEELRQTVELWSANTQVNDDFLSSLERAGVPVSEDDLTAIAQVLSGVSGPSPMCVPAVCVVAVAVAIGVTVVGYASVVLAATVVLLVAVSISATVQTAVGVGGGCTPPRCIHPNGATAPFSGVYARLEPSMIRNFDRSLRLAALTKDGNIEIEAMRSMISIEVSAVLKALKRVDLLNVRDESMPAAIDAVTSYAWKTLGIQVAA